VRLFEIFSDAATSCAVAKALQRQLGMGQAPLFQSIYKSPLVRKFFPPMDGDWQVTIRSNWHLVLRQTTGLLAL